MPEPREPLLLSARKAAPLLDTSPSTIYRMVADGELPHVLVRGSIRIPLKALEEFARPSMERDTYEFLRPRGEGMKRPGRGANADGRGRKDRSTNDRCDTRPERSPLP